MIGHNERIAWGFTTTTADVEDLFVEKIDPADPGRYLTPQGSLPFESRHETIVVKGADPVELTIRETRHGPVLSDALPSGAADPGFVLALAATFTISEDRTAEAVWDINRALVGQAFARPCRNLSDRSRTWSTPMSTARLASSLRGGCRSAPRGRAGCRRLDGPGSTIGPGSFRSLRFRAP